MAKAAKSSGGGFLELIKTLVSALLLAGVIRTLLFQPFWIPSGSMKETLLIGDFLFVNKFAYGYSWVSCPFSTCKMFEGAEDRLLERDPKRGDVVVFRHPSTGEDYIKRLIGLPGDTLEMVGGRVVLNGEMLPQTPDGTFAEEYAPQGPARNIPRCANGPVGLGNGSQPGATCEKPRAIETLPSGRSYAVLNISDGTSGDNRGPFTVPEDHFFFIGDNRDNSLDSRFTAAGNGVGFVPKENLIGRADRIMFSSAGGSILAFWAWRADRYLKAVN